MTTDLTKIVLTRLQIKELEAFQNGDCLKVDPSAKNPLVKYRLIRAHMERVRNTGVLSWDGSMEITEDGLTYLEYHRQSQRDKRVSDIRAWVAIGLSAAAIVISIAALLKK